MRGHNEVIPPGEAAVMEPDVIWNMKGDGDGKA